MSLTSKSITLSLFVLVFGHLSVVCSPLASTEEPIKWIKIDDYNQSPAGDGAKETSADLCEVCGESFNRLEGFTLACKHTFHEHCLRNWAYESEDCHRLNCPICMDEIRFEDGKDLAEFGRARRNEWENIIDQHWGVLSSIQGYHL